MSKYEVGKRVELALTLTGIYGYTKHYHYRAISHTVYKFVDAEGTVFVWDTSSALGIESTDASGIATYDGVRKGDSCVVLATIKGEGEYRGEAQIELTRAKLISVDHAPVLPTKEELQAARKAEQLASLMEGDFVWERMDYKQYKEHYADCETVAGSFFRNRYGNYIDVIIRAGRLKASGVRGKHYSGYELHFDLDGERVYTPFRAVSEENAIKQLMKEYPNAKNITCDKIYNYR
jgi:hypothetical protein